VDWKDRLPEGIGDVRDTETGFEAAISIPVDDDGFFGRQCPECERMFKMDVGEYEALPDDLELICPYCGERREHDEFMTRDQRTRVESAGQTMAEQYVHQAFDQMMRRTFGIGSRTPRRGSFISIEWRYQPGRPPIPGPLYEYLEDRVRRSVACSRCTTHVAVFGATAFCPVCGPREKAEEIHDAIAAQRLALALPDQLAEDIREEARAAGVFDQHTEGAIKEVVALFETSTRGVFVAAVTDHVRVLTAERRTVFQNLDEAGRLFRHHLSWDLRAAAGTDVLKRLAIVFEQRHVLVHRHGEVDARFVQRVAAAGVREGQRLTISRAQAERALDDLERIVDAVERLRRPSP
jgi:sarcosine oxidase delta subunit